MATKIAKIRAGVGAAVCTAALTGAMVTATPAQAAPLVSAPSSPFSLVEPALTPVSMLPLGVGNTDDLWYLQNNAVAASSPVDDFGAALGALIALPFQFIGSFAQAFANVIVALARAFAYAAGAR